MKTSTKILFGAIVGAFSYAIWDFLIRIPFALPIVVWFALVILIGMLLRISIWRSRLDAALIGVISAGMIILILLGEAIISSAAPRQHPFAWYFDTGHMLISITLLVWLPFWFGAVVAELALRPKPVEAPTGVVGAPDR